MAKRAVTISPADFPSRRGFTLLEIAIVLMIASLIIGSCLPVFLNWKTERKLREPSHALGTLVQRARTDALVSGLPSRLNLDTNGFAYGNERFRFAKNVRFRVRDPQDAGWRVPEGGLPFLIYSSGLCEPWRFEFSLEDGSFLRTQIDPLTGFFEEDESFVR